MSQLGSRRILVPVDFSERSGRVARWAADQLAEGGELIVIHVLAELAPHEPGHLWGRVTDADRRQKTEQYTKTWLEGLGVADSRVEVRIGSPFRRICEVARELDVDGIVIADHSHVADQVFPLSATTERVLRHAHCPVWVHR